MSHTVQPRDALGQFAGVAHDESDVQLADDQATSEVVARQGRHEQVAVRRLAREIRGINRWAAYLTIDTTAGVDNVAPQSVHEADGTEIIGLLEGPEMLACYDWANELSYARSDGWRTFNAGPDDSGLDRIDLIAAARPTTAEILNDAGAAADVARRAAERTELLCAKAIASIVRDQYPTARYVSFDTTDQGGDTLTTAAITDAERNVIDVDGYIGEVVDPSSPLVDLDYLASKMTDHGGPAYWMSFRAASTDEDGNVLDHYTDSGMVMDIDLALNWDSDR